MAFSLFLHDCKLCIKPVTSSFQSIYDPSSDSFRRQQSYWENTSFYITPQTAVTQVHVTLQTLLINVLSRRREALLLDMLMRWDWYDRQMLLCSDSSLPIKTVRIILSFWFFTGTLPCLAEHSNANHNHLTLPQPSAEKRHWINKSCIFCRSGVLDQLTMFL